MSRLWQVMTEMYGEPWPRSYGDTPPDSWAEALEPFEAHHIRAAVRACFRREDRWPPSLPEFVKLCKAAVSPQHVKSLPKPVLTDEQRQLGREMAEASRQIALGQVVLI